MPEPKTIAPTVFVSTANVSMPTAEERRSRRGGPSRTYYDLSNLAVGQSIVIIGRTAKQLNSTVSGANRADAKNFVTDDKGKPVMVPATDNKGEVIKENGKPVMVEKLKHFFVQSCNPETDPEKADARIWRDV